MQCCVGYDLQDKQVGEQHEYESSSYLVIGDHFVLVFCKDCIC